MAKQWRDDQPIYRQLQQEICTLIIQGSYPQGSALPSVRQLSVDLSINHLTVAKAYQELVADDLVEKRRGLGMFVREGAVATLKSKALNQFFSDELPKIAKQIHDLGIPLNEVISQLSAEYNQNIKEQEK